jgi:DivIVA domain-containing protein
VDFERAEHALASDRWYERKPVLDELRSADLQQRLRGYDRDQVDGVIQELIQN